MRPAILVAGIGNIFNRDDGFGVAVAARLAAVPLGENVQVRDFGIRGFDLVMALLEEPEFVIFVDTLARGGEPGTVYAMEPRFTGSEESMIDNAHGLDPVKVLTSAQNLGARLGRVVVVGCEPATLEDDTGCIGLSEPVEAAVEPAIGMIRALIEEFNQSKTAYAVGMEGPV